MSIKTTCILKWLVRAHKAHKFEDEAAFGHAVDVFVWIVGWAFVLALGLGAWAFFVDGLLVAMSGAGAAVVLAVGSVAASLGVLVGAVFSPLVAGIAHIVKRLGRGGRLKRWLGLCVTIGAAFALLFLLVRPFVWPES